MVIQLDIDGTIDRNPKFFSCLSRAFRADGHEVLVVTARIGALANLERTRRQLTAWGISYDELVMSPPYDEMDPRVCPKVHDWDHRRHLIKLITALGRGVNVAYDDSSEVADLFLEYAPSITLFRVMPAVLRGMPR